MNTLKFKLLAIIITLFSVLNAQKSKTILKFNKKETFKIIQFTDVHWSTGQIGNNATLAMMRDVLDMEKPNLVVFTGDIVLSEGEPDKVVKKGWREVCVPLQERKINWVAMLGNHDSEGNYQRDSVFSYLSSLPYNINYSIKNTQNDFYMPIINKNGQTSSVLYFFDSHEYAGIFEPGKYAWITDNQINWYKQTSNNFKKLNDNEPIPSIAFFHIPIPEYKDVAKLNNVVGHVNEDVSSPEINSGLFSAMALQDDIMGVFVGHDHNNDYIGEWYNIALAYGRCSGNNAYGDLRIGCRAISLYPNRFKFDTWIATPTQKKFPYSYPANYKPINKNSMLPAIKTPKKLKSGVSYTYFEGKIDSVAQIDQLKPKKNGHTSNFSLNPAEVEDHFAFKFNAYINIPENNMYTFYLRSDDGAVLYIDGKKVINNDGGHSAQMKKGFIDLEKGFHKIKVIYFEDYMGQVMQIGIESSTMKRNFINDKILFYE